MNDICVSIVSHRHGEDVVRLLRGLASLDEPRLRRVILTLNLPENELAATLRRQAWPFALEITENPTPKGFGANHNQAFALDARRGASEYFAVINPDIQLCGNPFDALLRRMTSKGARAGVSYPVQVGDDGRSQDHERLLPTPLRLVRRYLPGGPRREVRAGDRPDWVNAAFLLLRREAYASIGGFDETYHMYCEDVDLCLRLQLTGWQLVRVDEAVVVHEAQRASRRHPQHLGWHLRSLMRLWGSRVWRTWRMAAKVDDGSLDCTDSQ